MPFRSIQPTVLARDPAESRWLDRAASLVEDRLGRLGNGYLEALLGRFDHHWSQNPGETSDSQESNR